MLNSQQQEALWNDAALSGALLAVLGHDAGGALLRARPGPVRDHWLSELRRVLSEQTPWRKLPLHCAVDRLLGGLDLSATLRSGKPVAERGLLSECDGGFALLPMAERAEGELLAPLCSALDRGELTLERDGVTARMPAAFALVALDEGADEQEQVGASLGDRLALHSDLSMLSISACDDFPCSAADIAAARERVTQIELSAEQLQALCAASLALGIDSPRAPILASRVARAHAALRAVAPDAEAMEAALRLVMLPRATQLPAGSDDEDVAESEEASSQQPEDASQPPEPPPPDQSSAEGESEREDSPETDSASGDMPAERLLDAARAALPDALLEQLVSRALQNRQRGSGGKSGATQRHKTRGRPMGSIAGDPRRGARLDLVATLRAAAPWQKLRRQPGGGARVHVESGDFRVVRFRQRSQSVTVFVVDASGSSALYRLAEAKGAVELLLADCYVRRDEVALIAFRGERAEMLLPPTRSLVRAKRSLSALPGGGGTPLASAIDATTVLLEQIARGGATPAYVMLTDGRANVARDGSTGREAATADALEAARALRSQCRVAGMVIDTSPRPHRAAAALAKELDAVYLPLPHADASQLQAAVRGVTG